MTRERLEYLMRQFQPTSYKKFYLKTPISYGEWSIIAECGEFYSAHGTCTLAALLLLSCITKGLFILVFCGFSLNETSNFPLFRFNENIYVKASYS